MQDGEKKIISHTDNATQHCHIKSLMNESDGLSAGSDDGFMNAHPYFSQELLK